MIYFIQLFLLILFSYLYDYKKRTKNRDIAYFIVLFLFIVIAGFRYRLGVDSIRYESSFKYIVPLQSLTFEDLFQNDSYNPLFYLLLSFSKFISDDFFIVQLLQSILVNVCVCRFFKSNTSNLFFALLCYYVFLYLNFTCEVMKEACAVSMILLGSKYLHEKSWIKFYIFCILAFGFHNSAIFFLLFFPLLKILHIWDILRFNKFLLPLLCAVFVFGFTIQAIFFDYLQLISITEAIEGKVNDYANSELSSGLLNIIGILVNISIYIVYPGLAYKYANIDKKSTIESYEPMIVLGFIFVLLSMPIHIFYRYNNYFMPFIILSISLLPFSERTYIFKKKYITIKHYLVWFLIFLPFFLIKIHIDNAEVGGDSRYKEYMRYYPYSSVINKKISPERETIFYYYDAY